MKIGKNGEILMIKKEAFLIETNNQTNIPILKIPNEIYRKLGDEQYQMSDNLIGVWCYLFKNLNAFNMTFFHSNAYCDDIGKTTPNSQRFALKQAREILDWLESANYIRENRRIGQVCYYDVDTATFNPANRYIMITKDEYDTILRDTSVAGKNKAALISTLVAIKYRIHKLTTDGRMNDKNFTIPDGDNKSYPPNVCTYNTAFLAEDMGVNEKTFKKYYAELKNIGLIKTKTIHIPSATKGKYFNFAAKIPTSDKDYIQHLKEAEEFLYEKWHKTRKPKSDFEDCE